MPKWIIYCLAALGDLILAVIAFLNDRIVFTVILGLACLLFLAAAAGSLKQQKSSAS